MNRECFEVDALVGRLRALAEAEDAAPEKEQYERAQDVRTQGLKRRLEDESAGEGRLLGVLEEPEIKSPHTASVRIFLQTASCCIDFDVNFMM